MNSKTWFGEKRYNSCFLIASQSNIWLLFAPCLCVLFMWRPGYLEGRSVSGWLSPYVELGCNQMHVQILYVCLYIYTYIYDWNVLIHLTLLHPQSSGSREMSTLFIALGFLQEFLPLHSNAFGNTNRNLTKTQTWEAITMRCCCSYSDSAG